MRALALLALSLALSACSLRRAGEAVFMGRQLVEELGVGYGPLPRHQADVYRPRGANGAPVVVFLHGGRWRYGSRTDYRLLGNALTRRGIVAVVPDTRLYPDTTFPGWVNDAALAVRWVRDHAVEFGGDTSRIFVVGHSSGAHTAALLALDDSYLQRAGAAGAVRGYVAISGPVDTTWTLRRVQVVMGPPEGWPASYPAAHVGGDERPLLLLHGAADDVVGVGNSTRLAERIRERGGCSRAVVYPELDHVRIMIALAVPGPFSQPVLDDLAAFVTATVPCPFPAPPSVAAGEVTPRPADAARAP